MKRFALGLASFGLILFHPGLASASWSVGVGYHNPPSATAGLNFMYLWTNVAFELGLGYIGSSESANTTNNSNNNTYTLGGDANFKYLFGTQLFRPYIQGGLASALSFTSGNNGGVGATLSDPFAGAGLFIMGESFYVYASYVFINYNVVQAGIGFR